MKSKSFEIPRTSNVKVNKNNSHTYDNTLPQSSKKDAAKITSTPKIKAKKDLNENVKSIMKNSDGNTSLNLSAVNVPKQKPKKRNKSVSFMLEDAEEIVIKKSKSEASVVANTSSKKTNKKHKTKSNDGKENLAGENNVNVEMDTSDNLNGKISKGNKSVNGPTNKETDIPVNGKKDKKKNKKIIQKVSFETENQADVESKGVIKNKKPRKKKHQVKQAEKKSEAEDEAGPKSKVIKSDGIAADLENLTIGDNAHTLTNLLDEMTVVDKKKKNKRKPKNNKQITDNASTEHSEVATEEKEKVKWRKRKWNKDKKGGVSNDKVATSIIIENLPLKIMCSYKKLLTELFDKFGSVKSIGVAEVYCIEQPEFFTTTINFDSEDAANKALEEDNTLFEGSRIRVKRPLPPSDTTLVVRSYAELTELALSSVFTSAGRIRNVRRLVKGKKSMCTAFIEFDGPEAVERAVKMAEDVKICGKKIFAAKFDLRHSNKNKKFKSEKAIDNDAGSDDSSD